MIFECLDIPTVSIFSEFLFCGLSTLRCSICKHFHICSDNHQVIYKCLSVTWYLPIITRLNVPFVNGDVCDIQAMIGYVGILSAETSIIWRIFKIPSQVLCHRSTKHSCPTSGSRHCTLDNSNPTWSSRSHVNDFWPNLLKTEPNLFPFFKSAKEFDSLANNSTFIDVCAWVLAGYSVYE